jgi:hypothetical protein
VAIFARGGAQPFFLPLQLRVPLPTWMAIDSTSWPEILEGIAQRPVLNPVHTGVAGLIIGNTAENVLRQVDCSVLTVRPDRFVTPVRLNERGGDHGDN